MQISVKELVQFFVEMNNLYGHEKSTSLTKLRHYLIENNYISQYNMYVRLEIQILEMEIDPHVDTTDNDKLKELADKEVLMRKEWETTDKLRRELKRKEKLLQIKEDGK